MNCTSQCSGERDRPEQEAALLNRQPQRDTKHLLCLPSQRRKQMELFKTGSSYVKVQITFLLWMTQGKLKIEEIILSLLQNYLKNQKDFTG